MGVRRDCLVRPDAAGTVPALRRAGRVVGQLDVQEPAGFPVALRQRGASSRVGRVAGSLVAVVAADAVALRALGHSAAQMEDASQELCRQVLRALPLQELELPEQVALQRRELLQVQRVTRVVDQQEQQEPLVWPPLQPVGLLLVMVRAPP